MFYLSVPSRGGVLYEASLAKYETVSSSITLTDWIEAQWTKDVRMNSFPGLIS